MSISSVLISGVGVVVVVGTGVGAVGTVVSTTGMLGGTEVDVLNTGTVSVDTSDEVLVVELVEVDSFGRGRCFFFAFPLSSLAKSLWLLLIV